MIYPRAIRKLIPPGSNDPKITPTCVILHVAVSESASLYPYFNGRSGGVESHFYVRRDGTVEQYRDTSYQADAQLGGAWDEVSVETQGMGSGTWTPQQVTALVDLIRWLSTVHPIPLRLNDSETNPRGIGWHAQYRSWSGGDGRTCPGVDRVPQIKTQIVPALTRTPTTEGDTMSEQQAKDLFTGHRIVLNTLAPDPRKAARVTPSYLLEQTAALSKQTAAGIGQVQGQLAGLTKAVQQIANGEPVDLAAITQAARAGALEGVAKGIEAIDVVVKGAEQ